MNRLEKGIQIMNDVFGKEITSQMQNHLTSIYPPFADFLKATFGDIYSDNTFDLRTKEIIVLTALISQKDTKPQLKGHLKAAVKAGLSPKEILALILHLVLYIGFPSTINALNIAKETFDEIGVQLN